MAYLFVLLLSLFTFASSEDMCRAHDPESDLNALEKIAHFLLKNSRKTVKETKFIVRNPIDSLLMKNKSEFSLYHSQIFCRPKWFDKVALQKDTSDNKVDALRHFILSTLMQYYYPKKAAQILMAYEIDGINPLKAQNLMDIHNRLGSEFAESARKRNPKWDVDKLAELAFKEGLIKLNKQELEVLRPIEYGPCKDLSKKSAPELDALINQHLTTYQS